MQHAGYGVQMLRLYQCDLSLDAGLSAEATISFQTSFRDSFRFCHDLKLSHSFRAQTDPAESTDLRQDLEQSCQIIHDQI